MKNNRVFVSGGAGVIGVELVLKLTRMGAAVMVGDLKPRPDFFPSSVVYRQGDLNKIKKEEILGFKPNVFIHLAATFERSDESYSFWSENFTHNVNLSHYLMTLFKDVSTLKRVVFASSYLIYDPSLYQFNSPMSNAISLKESDPISPRNLTGAAKYNHEIEIRFLQQFAETRFTTVCARIFRGYGRNSRDIISRWIRDLLHDKPIKVFRPEGMFDYIYAADTAEGLIKLAENQKITGVINLGTGNARRISDVVDVLKYHFPMMTAEHVNASIPFEASEADISRLSDEAHWVPAYTLETAIPEIIQHEKNELNKVVKLKPNPIKILLSSASRKTSLVRAVIDACRKIDVNGVVVAGDLSPNILASYVADEFWQMPACEEECLSEILDGCKSRGINVVLPTRDGELLFWAKHSDFFLKNGIHVITSPVDSILNCIDKINFSIFCKNHCLPIIYTSESINDILSDRFVVKERYGAGSRSIGINLNKEEAIAHAKELLNPIFQPFISGVEISVDAWLDKFHKVKGIVLRRRDYVVAGESQVTTTFRDQIIEYSVINFLNKLNLSGPVVMQIIIDSENRLNIIECNARFGGGSTAALAVGLDSLYWSLLECQGVNLERYNFNRLPNEVCQVRVPSDIYFYK